MRREITCPRSHSEKKGRDGIRTQVSASKPSALCTLQAVYGVNQFASRAVSKSQGIQRCPGVLPASGRGKGNSSCDFSLVSTRLSRRLTYAAASPVPGKRQQLTDVELLLEQNRDDEPPGAPLVLPWPWILYLSRWRARSTPHFDPHFL